MPVGWHVMLELGEDIHEYKTEAHMGTLKINPYAVFIHYLA